MGRNPIMTPKPSQDQKNWYMTPNQGIEIKIDSLSKPTRLEKFMSEYRHQSILMREAIMKSRERSWERLAWVMPRPLVYWCAVRVGAHATVGCWGETNPKIVSITAMLQRWDKKAPEGVKITGKEYMGGGQQGE